jgi:hypothetical protein
MSNCAPGNLASTLSCCLCCFFFVYRPISLVPVKTPPLLLLLLCVCCCMCSQTITMGSCAYEAIVPEKKEE